MPSQSGRDKRASSPAYPNEGAAQRSPGQPTEGTDLMKAVKLTTFTILMVSIAGLLLVVASNPLFSFEPFESATVNSHINYQLSALPVAALAAVVTFLFAGKTMLRYLNFNREGVMKPFFSKKGKDGRWETDGRAIGLIMVAIIGVVTFFQLLPGGFSFHGVHLLLVIPLAASNAVVEETIYRLSFVSVGASATRTVWYGIIMGSVVFGGMHYWGAMPNGLVGALLSAFLGFFLAKSIQETKGIFWAFTIHFLLDVAILVFLLNGA